MIYLYRFQQRFCCTLAKIAGVFLFGFFVLQQAIAAPSQYEETRLLIQQGRLQDALQLVDSYLQPDQSDAHPGLLFLKGLVDTRMGMLDLAEKIFFKLAATYPELPEPYNNLAVVYAETGRLNRAGLSLAVLKHDKVPVYFVQIAEKQDYVIVVDLSIPRLFLFDNRNDTPRLIKDFYVSIGKRGIGKHKEGDQKTPVGVYFVTKFIDSKDLPDRYGSGAFPINYPNAIDKQAGRTGHGIWLHGVEQGVGSRPPRDSDGCIVLRNKDLEFISRYIKKGDTPVILAREIEWNDADLWQKESQLFTQYIARWRSDWASDNATRYLDHYSNVHMGTDTKIQAQYYLDHKAYYAKADLIRPSIFRYPGSEPIMLVAFMQEDTALSHRYIMRQYWKKEEDHVWRIIHEERISY